MNKRIGKSDLLVLCLLAAGILLAVLLQTPRKNPKAGGYAVITVGDREYARTPLNEYSVIPILDEEGNITNELTVSGGYAKMTAADCPDQLCVHQKRIRLKGETIVCLPNRVVISIEAPEEDTLDAIVR